ncbi:MAG: hypothetical protein FWD28_00040 [Treponema sp.]|nr:hypothetical protein [Treponema sp.]
MNKTQKYLIEYKIRDIICFISFDNNLSLEESMELFFNSNIFEKLQDIETGLYTESSSYIYEYFKEELK